MKKFIFYGIVIVIVALIIYLFFITIGGSSENYKYQIQTLTLYEDNKDVYVNTIYKEIKELNDDLILIFNSPNSNPEKYKIKKVMGIENEEERKQKIKDSLANM